MNQEIVLEELTFNEQVKVEGGYNLLEWIAYGVGYCVSTSQNSRVDYQNHVNQYGMIK